MGEADFSGPKRCAQVNHIQGFPGGPTGKEPACQHRRHKRSGFNPWVGKISWRRAWQPTPEFLPGKFRGQRSLVGYSPLGCKELDMTEATKHACTRHNTGLSIPGSLSQRRGTFPPNLWYWLFSNCTSTPTYQVENVLDLIFIYLWILFSFPAALGPCCSTRVSSSRDWQASLWQAHRI